MHKTTIPISILAALLHTQVLATESVYTLPRTEFGAPAGV